MRPEQPENQEGKADQYHPPESHSPRNEFPQPVTQSLHPGACPERLPETGTRRNAPGGSAQQAGPEKRESQVAQSSSIYQGENTAQPQK